MKETSNMSSPSPELTHKATVAYGKMKKKSFNWDQVIFYMGFVLLGLLTTAFGEVFLSESTTVTCLTPGNFTRQQSYFVNRFCSNVLFVLKRIPLFLLAELAFTLGPHQVWENYAGPSIQHFFSMVSLISRRPDRHTGLFDADTREIVKHLCEDYGNRKNVCRLYWVKLFMQLLGAVLGIGATSLVLYFNQTYFFEDMINCYLDENVNQRDWFQETLSPLCPDANYSLCGTEGPVRVLCKNSVSLASFLLWIISGSALAIDVLAAGRGLYWCHCQSHWKELDGRGEADFLYTFCSNRGRYCPKDSWKRSQTIKTDLDLFTMMLFSSDKGQGKSFHEIVVALSLDEFWQQDNREHIADQEEAEDKNFIRDLVEEAEEKKEDTFLFPNIMLLWLKNYLQENVHRDISKGGKNGRFELGLQIFCGSKGATPLLANFCEKFVAVDFNWYFDPYYLQQNFKQKDREIVIDQTIGRRGRFKGNWPQKEPDYLYRHDFHGVYIHAVPENEMTRSDAEVILLTEPLRFYPRSVRKSAEYDLVVITQLEKKEAEEYDRNRIYNAPRITAAKQILESIEIYKGENDKETVFCFCTRSKAELQALTDNLEFKADDSGSTLFQSKSSELEVFWTIGKWRALKEQKSGENNDESNAQSPSKPRLASVTSIESAL
eukprot:m.113778 g.113778  ORF g.113778 m.113778 type:complete len:661 (+) comp37464_c0_seq1:67-2049(+)